MKITLCTLAAFAALLVFNPPAVAHHSFAAEFDAAKPITINGAVNKMDWVNPHSWIYVDVKEADGSIVTWRFEMGPPNALLRMGWRKDSIPPGTRFGYGGSGRASPISRPPTCCCSVTAASSAPGHAPCRSTSTRAVS